MLYVALSGANAGGEQALVKIILYDPTRGQICRRSSNCNRALE